MSLTQGTSVALQQTLTQVYPTETGRTIQSREHSLHFIQDTSPVCSHHRTAQQLSLQVTQTGTITPRTLVTDKGQHCLICHKGFANYRLILIETVRPMNENIPTLLLCEVCAFSSGKTRGCSSNKKLSEQTHSWVLSPATLLAETSKCAHVPQKCKYCCFS